MTEETGLHRWARLRGQHLAAEFLRRGGDDPAAFLTAAIEKNRVLALHRAAAVEGFNSGLLSKNHRSGELKP